MNKRVPTATVIDILRNYKEYIEPQEFESLELAYAIQRGIESLKKEQRECFWISAEKTLPTEKDADLDGLVLGKWSSGAVREVVWGTVADLMNQKRSNYLSRLISWARMPEGKDP